MTELTSEHAELAKRIGETLAEKMPLIGMSGSLGRCKKCSQIIPKRLIAPNGVCYECKIRAVMRGEA
jgi:hypothetical protein